MKVLIVDSSRDITGAFNAALCIAEKLHKPEAMEFSFCLPSNSALLELFNTKGFICITYPVHQLSRRLSDIVFYLPFTLISTVKLVRFIKRNNIEVLHQNELFLIFCFIVRALTKVKLVTHIRVLPFAFPQWLYKFWLFLAEKLSDRIVTVSYFCKTAVNNFGVVTKPILMVYDFIPREASSVGVKLSTLDKPVRILFLGNYTIGKGQDLALHALARVKEINPSLRFTIQFYGSDMGLSKNLLYKEALVDLSQQLGLRLSVNFNDRILDTQTAIRSADIVLNLSKYESFSFVVAEAMSCSACVVATKSGGPEELIVDGESGFLCDHSVDDISRVLVHVSSSRALMRQVGRNAHLRISSLLAARGGSDLLTRLYDFD